MQTAAQTRSFFVSFPLCPLPLFSCFRRRRRRRCRRRRRRLRKPTEKAAQLAAPAFFVFPPPFLSVLFSVASASGVGCGAGGDGDVYEDLQRRGAGGGPGAEFFVFPPLCPPPFLVASDGGAGGGAGGGGDVYATETHRDGGAGGGAGCCFVFHPSFFIFSPFLFLVASDNETAEQVAAQAASKTPMKTHRDGGAGGGCFLSSPPYGRGRASGFPPMPPSFL